jgi:phosphoglycerate dehydrogenase-like enzyme
MRKLNGLYILDTDALDQIYGPAERADIERLVDLVALPQTRQSIAQHPSLLRNVDVILSGWGGPHLSEAFLDAAPNLKAFFYGAGTVGHCLTEAVWRREILVTTANAANAVPVAEYTVAMMEMALKQVWRFHRFTREARTFIRSDDVAGGYGSTVGLISLGTMGRAVLSRLRSHDLNVVAYDPFIDRAEAQQVLRVELLPLAELFRRCDVVSLHSPNLDETRGMITGELLMSMKPGATFINTARGEIVCEAEMLDVAARRPDLQFIVDVTEPEPPPADSPFYTLPNMLLTPHIAGSIGPECRRMGRYMVEELERFTASQPLKWQVTRESTQHSTHRPVISPVQVTTFVDKSPPPRAPAARAHG